MISVPLLSARYKRVRVAQLLQKTQHVASSLPLLFDGVRRISQSESDWLGWLFWLGTAELVTGGLVLGALVQTIQRIRRSTADDVPGHGHAHHGPDWLDVFLAVMLAVEVIVHHDETGHWRRPTILLALTTLFLGVFHGRIIARAAARRSLRVSDAGIDVPGRFRFFTRVNASWQELDRIDISPAGARIVTRRGRERRLTFSELLRGGEVREAMEVAKARLAEYKNSTTHASTDRSPGRDSSGRQQTETH